MKIIVTTGVSDGIGAEIARQLAASDQGGVGVSVTTAYPGVVTTNIRYRGLNAASVAAGSSGLKEDGAMRVQECASLIINGMRRREREVVMTGKGKLGRFLKLILPGVVEKRALAALKDDVKPKSQG